MYFVPAFDTTVRTPLISVVFRFSGASFRRRRIFAALLISLSHVSKSFSASPSSIVQKSSSVRVFCASSSRLTLRPVSSSLPRFAKKISW